MGRRVYISNSERKKVLVVMNFYMYSIESRESCIEEIKNYSTTEEAELWCDFVFIFFNIEVIYLYFSRYYIQVVFLTWC